MNVTFEAKGLESVDFWELSKLRDHRQLSEKVKMIFVQAHRLSCAPSSLPGMWHQVCRLRVPGLVSGIGHLESGSG